MGFEQPVCFFFGEQQVGLRFSIMMWQKAGLLLWLFELFASQWTCLYIEMLLFKNTHKRYQYSSHSFLNFLGWKMFFPFWGSFGKSLEKCILHVWRCKYTDLNAQNEWKNLQFLAETSHEMARGRAPGKTRERTRERARQKAHETWENTQERAWERAREHETLSAPERAREQRDSTR